MERTEAIEVIRKNWPDASFTQLREALETLIPELKEIEDEMIRKEIRNFLIDMECKEEWISYLEKQKEQKPAWSEEDEKKIHFLSRIIELQVKDDKYCFGDGSLISKQEAIEMLNSLRPSWKPSKEQMEALESAVKLYKDTHFEIYHERIVSLYEQLKQL